jgi:GNAT superfamily N-acetyltransferase
VHARHVSTAIEYRWRSPVSDDELYALTLSHGGQGERGWWDRVRPHSLGWATAHLADGTLVGFVNVAWDGGDHAFLLDTKTRPDHQRRGIATRVVRLAARHARQAGCEWLHVDFDDANRLSDFYFGACGFRPTAAGLVHLPDLADAAPLAGAT